MTWCSKCGAPNRVTAEVGQSRVEYACREQFVCALDGESTAAPSIIRYRIGVESCNADPVPTRPDPRRAGFYMGTGPTLLFDDLVGAQQNRWRYGKAKRLGGLEVHDHLEFCRKLHR